MARLPTSLSIGLWLVASSWLVAVLARSTDASGEVVGTAVLRMGDMAEDRRIAFRIGINIGDIIVDGDDIFGDGVNVAARLQEIASPGGICISSRVHDDVRDRLDTAFDDGGTPTLKNIARPVQVWRWQPGTAVAPKPAPPPTVLPLPDKPSIAVLPFQNMSDDPDQEYFADGMVEDIITGLWSKKPPPMHIQSERRTQSSNRLR